MRGNAKGAVLVKGTWEDRFWLRVIKTETCWLWNGDKTKGGYGLINRGHTSGGPRQRRYAHRFSYELHHGAIPDGMHVRHKCDNPPCVNPDHLELGHAVDNARDKRERGREPLGERRYNATLSEDQVRAIHALISAVPMREIASRTGVALSTVRAVRYGRTWQHLGLPTIPLTHPQRRNRRRAE